MVQGRVADMRTPARQDFNPSRVVDTLGYFWILRREPGSDRWAFALAGEEIVRLMGRKLIGERVEDVFPADAERFYAAIDAVVSTPAALHCIGPMYRTDRASVTAGRLALPMRGGEAVDRVYGATIYHWPEEAPVGAVRYQGTVAPTLVPVVAIGRALS